MRRLLSAIAAAIRSTVNFVWERCRDTGAWTLKVVASVVGSGAVPAPDAGPLQELEAAMAAEAAEPAGDLIEPAGTVVVPPAHGGDGYDRIQRACRDINTGGKPACEDWQALSPVQRDWLQELTPPMRLLVGNVEREALLAHMKGGKGLRGVIRSDEESIQGWRRATAIEQAIADIDAAEPAAPKMAI